MTARLQFFPDSEAVLFSSQLVSVYRYGHKHSTVAALTGLGTKGSLGNGSLRRDVCVCARQRESVCDTVCYACMRVCVYSVCMYVCVCVCIPVDQQKTSIYISSMLCSCTPQKKYIPRKKIHTTQTHKYCTLNYFTKAPLTQTDKHKHVNVCTKHMRALKTHTQCHMHKAL